MFCSRCGNQLASELNFCSRCGAATERNAAASGSVRPFAIGATVIGFVGLAAFIPFLRMLLESQLNTRTMVFLVVGYLLTLLIMFGSMMSMATRLAGFSSSWDPKSNRRRRRGEQEPEPVSFREVNTHQLYPGDAGVGSITDSTTRTLDEAMAERRR